MADGLHRDWQRLAREMASSFTDERAALVKKKTLGSPKCKLPHLILPPGTRLVNRTLGEALGISTIPVRVAPHRLGLESALRRHK